MSGLVRVHLGTDGTDTGETHIHIWLGKNGQLSLYVCEARLDLFDSSDELGMQLPHMPYEVSFEILTLPVCMAVIRYERLSCWGIKRVDDNMVNFAPEAASLDVDPRTQPSDLFAIVPQQMDLVLQDGEASHGSKENRYNSQSEFGHDGVTRSSVGRPLESRDVALCWSSKDASRSSSWRTYGRSAERDAESLGLGEAGRCPFEVVAGVRRTNVRTWLPAPQDTGVQLWVTQRVLLALSMQCDAACRKATAGRGMASQ